MGSVRRLRPALRWDRLCRASAWSRWPRVPAARLRPESSSPWNGRGRPAVRPPFSRSAVTLPFTQGSGTRLRSRCRPLRSVSRAARRLCRWTPTDRRPPRPRSLRRNRSARYRSTPTPFGHSSTVMTNQHNSPGPFRAGTPLRPAPPGPPMCTGAGTGCAGSGRCGSCTPHPRPHHPPKAQLLSRTSDTSPRTSPLSLDAA